MVLPVTKVHDPFLSFGRRGRLTLLPLSLALALATACDRRSEETSATRTTSASDDKSAMQPTTPAALTLSEDDKEFLTKAAQGNMLEVAIGQSVAQRAVSPEAKAFAMRMVTDHGKATEELKVLAVKKGVTLPTQLDAKHLSKADELQKLSGGKLDKEFADDMVDDHEEDVKEFRKAAKEVRDPDLRAWAEKTLPILEGHLAMARDLESKTHP
jgi:putative membrane protein